MAPLPDEQQPERATPRPDAASGPLEEPESRMPPHQEDQPAPTFPRWMYGVGAAVVLFAIVWVLLNVL